MSFSVTDAFVQQFSGNVGLLAQQFNSRLRGRVIEDQITGESGYMEQVAPTAARKVTSRHADSPLMNTQHLRRRISTYDWDWGDLVDKADKVRLLIDPASTYAKQGAAAMKRAQDDEIISAAWATAYAGHNGNTAITWPNGNAESSPTAPGGTQIAVNSWAFGNGSGNAGLTVSKLIEASVALNAAEGDEEEERYILCTAKNIGQLLATTEATSSDFTDLKALNEGKIDRFMGFTFIRSERLQLDASGYTRVMAWRKSGFGLGIGQDVDGRIAERPDKKFSVYVYADQVIGASRMEESKIAEIKCL